MEPPRCAEGAVCTAWGHHGKEHVRTHAGCAQDPIDFVAIQEQMGVRTELVGTRRLLGLCLTLISLGGKWDPLVHAGKWEGSGDTRGLLSLSPAGLHVPTCRLDGREPPPFLMEGIKPPM